MIIIVTLQEKKLLKTLLLSKLAPISKENSIYSADINSHNFDCNFSKSPTCKNNFPFFCPLKSLLKQVT